MDQMTQDDLKDIFSRRPLDLDTKILCQQYTTIHEIPVLLEYWFWDGYYGRSVVFRTDDVAHWHDQELFLLVKRHIQIAEDFEGITLKRGDSFTFFNYDFSSSES